MQNRTSLAPLALAALLATPTLAQDPCEGNNLGPVYLEASPAYLGGAYEINLGSPLAPLGIGLISISSGYGPVFHPLLGVACLDMFSPFYQIFLVNFDAAGNFNLSVGLPNDASLLSAPPIYVAPTAFVGGEIWNGKTVPLYYTFADSWTPTEALPSDRAFMEATNLGDGPQDNRIQVFLSGGSVGALVEPDVTDETWIYQPLDRTTLFGPTMSVERVGHTQTKLADGRILIAGGNDTTGICHASAEIYDHTTGTLTAAGSMSAARSGHAATLLPDGRVLVTGGLADFQNAGTALKAALDTAQDTAEIYDPVTDTWSATAGTMLSARSGHEQALWPDGRVLVISGSDGGTIASFTGNETVAFTGLCDWFDPSTGTFSPAASLGTAERAYFASSFLGDGRLLVSGGMTNDTFGGSAIATNTLYTFDGTAWTQQGLFFGLPVGAAFHTQVTLNDGSVLIGGGFNGYLDYLEANYHVSIFDGTSIIPARNIGQSEGTSELVSSRGGHTMTKMWDGTVLVLGGISGSVATPPSEWGLDSGFIYAP